MTSSLTLDAEGPARLVLAIAVADGLAAEETLAITQDGVPLEVAELSDAHGTRLHEVDVTAGRVEVRYSARVEGRGEPAPVDELDDVRYRRPSRYCESDTLAAVAAAEFAGLGMDDLLPAVSSWVGTQLAYDGSSTDPTGGAVATLLSRRGVCRDFAHLVVALLRALGVPARVVAVYAPGLEPMDFHAVAEALVEGRWLVVDATTLAPRASLVRIATGRDAADTAFLTTIGEAVRMVRMEVTATADALPDEDVRTPVALG
ncbi:Transglutaminase-like enzyme, putative cysteine protease [Demequina mangrovi]|uniref:Transglutaminase-like enzyme, putative cysteine protease n=1 Tax=Demequina mangrovi TaxID=1043493 RepID=A0A1H6YE20_9MICO|nr:Transglutaminase-like enzyme, putative cysteine protease [Demequina mangrovi]